MKIAVMGMGVAGSYLMARLKNSDHEIVGYERMTEDMDINCGKILMGESNIEEMGKEIFQYILDIASGQQSKSEINGVGDLEFIPWQMGAFN